VGIRKGDEMRDNEMRGDNNKKDEFRERVD
jgi:hypothetical protein